MNRTERTLIILAALFVLFSALLAPLVSAGLAVIFLLILGGYKLLPTLALGLPEGSNMKRFALLKVCITLMLVFSIAAAQGPAETPLPTSHEVSFPSGDIMLAGTLTLPKGEGPHPVLVTITGSGEQDRDNAHSSLPGYRPFQWLAEHLAEHGISVLRYDERGVGASGGEFTGATSADFASDTEAAIHYLLTRPEIDPKGIGLLGHSEGSIIAGMVAARNDDVAFVISMAGQGVDGYTLMTNQIENLAYAQAPDEAFAERILEMELQAMALTLEEDWEALEAHLTDSYLLQFEMLPDEQRPPQEQLEALARQTAEQSLANVYMNPWYRFFLQHDPGRDWANISVPVLLLFAEHDLNVDPELNGPALEQALASNEDVATITIENANHLFLADETGDPMMYTQLDMAFAPGVLEAVTAWLLERVEVQTP